LRLICTVGPRRPCSRPIQAPPAAHTPGIQARYQGLPTQTAYRYMNHTPDARNRTKAAAVTALRSLVITCVSGWRGSRMTHVLSWISPTVHTPSGG
jgi:hypothetical protein